MFEKLAVQDRERAMKLAKEARAVPAAVEEIEVQSQSEIAGPAEPAQEPMSVQAPCTEPAPACAASADGNDAKVQPAESEQPTAASASASTASAGSDSFADAS